MVVRHRCWDRNQAGLSPYALKLPFVGKVRKFDTAISFTAQCLRHCQLVVRLWSALVWSVLTSIHYGPWFRSQQHCLATIPAWWLLIRTKPVVGCLGYCFGWSCGKVNCLLLMAKNISTLLMMAVMDTGCNKQKIEAINFKILLFIICN